MPLFPTAQLAEWSRGRWTVPPGAPVTGFGHDTRTLRPGQVFVALATGRRDGHAFLRAAQAAGAAGAIVQRADPALPLSQLVVSDPLTAFQAIARAHRRTFAGPVIGITGSAGKTSTKDLLSALLGGDRDVLATEGNLNNHIGVPLTLTRIDAAVHRFAVVEAGVGATGEMAPLAEMISPDLALITLVAPAHLAGLGDVEGVAREKALLPAALRATGVALFPRHCEQFGAFRDLRVRRIVIEPAEVVLPSEPAHDRVYFAISQRGDGTALTIVYPAIAARLKFTLQRVSAGMAQNAVLAICAALWLGVTPAMVQARIGAWQLARWRAQMRHERGRFLYLDFYNANPASMVDALDNFESLAPSVRPRAYVLGCMEELGARTAEYHRQLGRALRLRPEDRLFIVGDHAGEVRAGLLEAGGDPEQIQIAAAAADLAATLAEFRGSVFLKGSRRYQLEKALAGEAGEREPVAC
ncbi:MAG: hypothetical protein A3G75_06135 [Verrucomicrobia bacterium RIFCSPLOWO2_12_FULL_64_8]|nr:MAG: hypothetical protein A3G75_06135 [Verrucomicrobia bacterium RIFCSPLOWO2_12_FULL_64_8]